MNTFEAYSWQHAAPVIFFLLAGVLLIRIGRRSDSRTQVRIGVLIASIVLAFMIGGSVIRWVAGTWDYRYDLPLYLCRIVAWLLPFVIWRQSRYWLGVFYFWVLAGTLQGIVTPDLAEGFPAYLYFRYWFLHAGLVVTIIYCTIVFRIRITWKDFWRAVGLAQVYVIGVHLINLAIGSNYSYTVQKPPGPSLLDMFGEWPWYILGGEALMVVLFLLLMLPWVRPAVNR